MRFDLFTYLTSLGFIYVYGRIIIHLAPNGLYYFLNSSTNFNAQLDKPRMLFHLVGLSFMHLMFSFSESLIDKSISLRTAILIVFCLGVLFCHLAWTTKFTSSFLPRLKKTTTTSLENFNISISNAQLTQLYNELVRFDLINQDRTSFEDFKNVLLKDWKNHNSKLYLKMDAPTCREFYSFLNETFPKNSMSLTNFISSKLFVRPDGKFFKYNTLKNAPTKTPYSKNYKNLQHIFDRI